MTLLPMVRLARRVRAARLGPVLQQLHPRLQTIIAAAAPRWTQQLAIGILGRVALAIAAVLDLPGRAISSADKPTLRDDIEALIAFFVRQCRKRAAVAQALEAQRRGARRATRRSARGQAPRRTATTFFSKYYMNSSRIKGGKASS